LSQLAKQFAPASDNLGDAEESAATSLTMDVPEPRASINLVQREIDEGSSLKIEVVSQDPALPLVLGASCRGALVAQREVALPRSLETEAVRQEIELPLPEGATGPVHVALFDYSQSPPALVVGEVAFCRPRRQLRIQATPLPAAAPGETQTWEVAVSDENGAPVQALLSVAGVVQLAKEPEIVLSFADGVRRAMDRGGAAGAPLDAVNEVEEAKRGLAGNAAVPAESTPAQQPALAYAEGLGSFGFENWRFEPPPLKNAESFGMNLGGLSGDATGVAIEPPLVADNAAAIQSRLDEELAQLRRQREEAGATLARISVIGGAILLVLLLGTAFLQRTAPTWVWTASLAAALAAVGAGFAGQGAPQDLPQVAFVPFPSESEAPADIAILDPAPAQDALGVVDRHELPTTEADQRDSNVTSSALAGGESKTDQLDVWLPRLSTGNDGKATISIPRPREAAMVRLSLEAHGAGRTGQTQVEVQVLPRE
jgi:hypothetical protein